jgi:hypothetical protein
VVNLKGKPMSRDISPPRFKLGDRVQVRTLKDWSGPIIELRGPLGPGGAQVYRVSVWEEPYTFEVELTEDQLELAPVPTSHSTTV